MKQQEPNATHLEKALNAEIARKNFVRAVILAQELQRPEAEVRHLQELALKQIQQNSKASWRKPWMSTSDRVRSGQRYDTTTGEYLTLREWIERFLKRKGKT
jgi:hypothetical protein